MKTEDSLRRDLLNPRSVIANCMFKYESVMAKPKEESFRFFSQGDSIANNK